MNQIPPMQLPEGPRSAEDAYKARYGLHTQPVMTLAQWLQWLSDVHHLFPPPPRRRPFVERDMRL